jgi:hypothetical protein
MTTKEIVRALRCTSTPGDHTSNCEQCPYWKKEQLNERLKEELGTDTWTSCDIDKVGLDAADLIERLTAENAVLREGESLGKAKRPQKIAYEKSIEFLRALTDGQSDEIKSFRRELEWKDMVIALAQKEQEKAEAERDAALADLADARTCKTCKYACDTRDCSSCKSKTCKCRECHLDKNAWEWRGLPEAPEEGEKA